MEYFIDYTNRNNKEYIEDKIKNGEININTKIYKTKKLIL